MTGLLRAGYRFGAAVLSNTVAVSLGVADQTLAKTVLSTADELVSSMGSTGASYAGGIPVAIGDALFRGQGLGISVLVPFKGTMDRAASVAMNCGR